MLQEKRFSPDIRGRTMAPRLTLRQPPPLRNWDRQPRGTITVVNSARWSVPAISTVRIDTAVQFLVNTWSMPMIGGNRRLLG